MYDQKRSRRLVLTKRTMGSGDENTFVLEKTRTLLVNSVSDCDIRNDVCSL